jgi:glycosyltransferase involved in cell wall biosynthesis
MSRVYAIISYWGWPILGGGEQFLADTMIWAKEMGLQTIWICFASPTSKGPLFFEHTKIQKTSYGNVIQVKGGYTNEKLKEWLGRIRPRIVHHQGHFRNEMMRVCQEMKIPFISGIHFWLDVIELDPTTFNKDIIKNKEKHKTSPKLKEAIEGCSLLYACSDFVVDAVKSVTGFQLEHVLYPISNESRIKCVYGPGDFEPSPRFVTMINIHELKGGKIFLYCIENLPDIPFLGIQTEPLSNDLDSKIEKAIERRNSDKQAKKCILMQRTEDIKSVYSQTKMLMVPSLVDETFCKGAQEGLCNGIPIISSSQGYLPYMIDKAGIVMNTFNPREWAEKINTLYNSEESLQSYSQSARSRYLEKYSEIITKAKFGNFISLCLKNTARIAIFTPWADQGLGIQAKTYAKFFLEMGYSPFIFSFRSYFCSERKYQRDETEWKIKGVYVYYSSNNREDVTDEEVIEFITKHDIRFLMIPETCFFRVFEIAKLAQSLGVRTIAIPNIETVRTSEIDHHKYFDDILCNNMFTYQTFQELGFDNSYYIGYSLFGKCTPSLAHRPIQKEGIKFLCICGLNSVVRKQAYLVLKAFHLALKKGLKSTLTLTIQGSQVPPTDSFNDPRINIIVEHLPGEEIINLYRSHHIFIQVSKHEGLGLGFHEALSYGLPVVTLNTPPHNEIVISDCGWIIDCQHEKMKDNDQGIIESAVFRVEDLANGFLKAEKEYTPQSSIKAYRSYMSRYNREDFVERMRKFIELV